MHWFTQAYNLNIHAPGHSELVNWFTQANNLNMGAHGQSGYLRTGALIHSSQQSQYGCTRSLRLLQYWCIDSLRPTTSKWVHQVTQATSVLRPKITIWVHQVTLVLVHWFIQAVNLNMGAPGQSGYLSTGASIHAGQQLQYGWTRSLWLPEYWCTDSLRPTTSIWVHQVT